MKAEKLIEQVVAGEDPRKLVEASKLWDIHFVKSILKAIQNQSQDLIRAGRMIPKEKGARDFDTATAHMAEAIDALDQWIEKYGDQAERD